MKMIIDKFENFVFYEQNLENENKKISNEHSSLETSTLIEFII